MLKKVKQDDTIMIVTEDGLFDYVSEREFKRQKKAEKREYKREYNKWRKENHSDTTIIAILIMGMVSFFCGFGGFKNAFLALVATGISMYLYWIEAR